QLDHRVCGPPSEFRHRLMNGADAEHVHHRLVVESHHLDVFGHPQVPLAQALDHTDGQRIAGARDAVDLGKALEDLLDDLFTALHVDGLRLEHATALRAY